MKNLKEMIKDISILTILLSHLILELYKDSLKGTSQIEDDMFDFKLFNCTVLKNIYNNH